MKNHPHDNIYSILGKLDALQPKQVIKESSAPSIREYAKVDAQGSILAGVKTLEQTLSEKYMGFKAVEKSAKASGAENPAAVAAAVGRKKYGQKEMTRRSVAGKKHAHEDYASMGTGGMAEERETLKTKTGTIYKGGKYGNEVDVNSDSKPKEKTGKKGRPIGDKEDREAGFKGNKSNDPFGRTPDTAPKGEKGKVIRGKGNIDTVDEVITKKTPAGEIIKDFQKSKNPKFAGKSKEQRKNQALGAYYGMHPEKSKHESRMNESVNFQALAKKHGMGMDECMNTLNDHYNKYKMTGECSDLLNGAMQLHNHHRGEVAEVSAHPLSPNNYESPAYMRRDQFPGTLPDTNKFDQQERGHHVEPKWDAPQKLNNLDRELDELAELAGLNPASKKVADEGAGVMHFKKEKAQQAGKDSFELGGHEYPVNEQNMGPGTGGMEEERQVESALQAYLGNKKYGKDGMDALRKAGREHAGKETMANIRDKYDKMDEEEATCNECGMYESQCKCPDMEEGNEFSGELAKARAQHQDHFSVDGHEYPVQEGKECDVCHCDPCECDDDKETAIKEARELVQIMKIAGLNTETIEESIRAMEEKLVVNKPKTPPINSGDKEEYQSMKASTMGPGEGDPGEKQQHPNRPTFKNGDNALAKPARNESVLKLEGQLAAEYESIKKVS